MQNVFQGRDGSDNGDLDLLSFNVEKKEETEIDVTAMETEVKELDDGCGLLSRAEGIFYFSISPSQTILWSPSLLEVRRF